LRKAFTENEALEKLLENKLLRKVFKKNKNKIIGGKKKWFIA